MINKHYLSKKVLTISSPNIILIILFFNPVLCIASPTPSLSIQKQCPIGYKLIQSWPKANIFILNKTKTSPRTLIYTTKQTLLKAAQSVPSANQIQQKKILQETINDLEQTTPSHSIQTIKQYLTTQLELHKKRQQNKNRRLLFQQLTTSANRLTKPINNLKKEGVPKRHLTIFLEYPSLFPYILKSSNAMWERTKYHFGKNNLEHGIENAITHAYWMISLAKSLETVYSYQEILKILATLSEIHEQFPENPPLIKAMDIHNNSVGIALYKKHATVIKHSVTLTWQETPFNYHYSTSVTSPSLDFFWTECLKQKKEATIITTPKIPKQNLNRLVFLSPTSPLSPKRF